MKKRVNIKSPHPLYIFSPPMEGTFMNHELTIGDIKACLNQGAYVEEILSDKSTIRLTLKNYDKNNEPVKNDKQKIDKKLETTIDKKVTEKKETSETEVKKEVTEIKKKESNNVKSAVKDNVKETVTDNVRKNQIKKEY